MPILGELGVTVLIELDNVTGKVAIEPVAVNSGSVPILGELGVILLVVLDNVTGNVISAPFNGIVDE